MAGGGIVIESTLHAHPAAAEDREVARPPIATLPAPPLRPLAEAAGSTRGDRVRRIVNVLAAGVGLLLAAPLMVLIGAAIAVTSGVPILYSQPRIGLDRRTRRAGPAAERRTSDQGGRPFRIYKFRTMRVGTDENQLWASPGDPRVTRLGRVLRRLRLDELPQLYNVLIGDMNVVGPRPEQPRIFLELSRDLPDYAHRQRVLPGITGWAQINHHYDRYLEDVKRKLSLDLEYMERLSAAEDLRIMARTLPVMLRGTGGW